MKNPRSIITRINTQIIHCPHTCCRSASSCDEVYLSTPWTATATRPCTMPSTPGTSRQSLCACRGNRLSGNALPSTMLQVTHTPLCTLLQNWASPGLHMPSLTTLIGWCVQPEAVLLSNLAALFIQVSRKGELGVCGKFPSWTISAVHRAALDDYRSRLHDGSSDRCLTTAVRYRSELQSEPRAVIFHPPDNVPRSTT